MAGSHDEAAIKKSYMKVFYLLMGFTALTILASQIDTFFATMFGHTGGTYVNMTVGLIIATIKVVLVMYIFMHLKFDNKYLRAFVYVPIFLFIVMVFALNVLETFNHP
ncbi:MAG: cytochrome C oxidase subunit IV family protein [Bacteriodetes bacterium]|nr:cytochrome C oxidase subunit IV family protein [Bacteroidota bacterium]